MIKAIFQIAIREIIRFLMRIFCVFKIKKNRIVFQAYDGKQYSCNPKYICEYMKTHYNGAFELVWIFLEPKSFESIEGIKPVKCYTLKWIYYVMTAKVIVSNTRPKTIVPHRKGQYFIETWHAGGAYKEVGINVKSQTRWEKKVLDWSQKKERQKTSLFLSSSQMFTKYNINIAHDYHGEILCSGMPRNDLFFDVDRFNKIREKTRQKLHLKGTVLLFAPTWRKSTEEDSDCNIAAEALNCILRVAKDEWQTDVSVMYRGHHWTKKNIADFNDVIDVTSYPDMQELLCAADILITDYSSCIWDFALTQRPCFLFVPDLTSYGNETHGFCTPIKTWPGKVCENKQELYNELSSIDKAEHSKKAEEHMRKFGSYEKGTACQQVVNKIIEYTNK